MIKENQWIYGLRINSKNQAYSGSKKFSRLWPILQVQEKFPDALRAPQRLPFAATNLFGTRRWNLLSPCFLW